MFLPYHEVLKQDRTTTKLRIVFGGSAKSNYSISLNECLYKGSKLLNDLTGMLLKFRIGSIAMTCDLEEAFLQIGIKEVNRDYLKFLWIENEEMKSYRFKRLPFGLSCSPFILNATIKFHCDMFKTDIFKNFYVDDFVYTGDDVTSLSKMAKDTVRLMELAGFNLRKWSSNSEALSNSDLFKLADNSEKTHSVLGILWSPKTDSISLKYEPVMPNTEILTKRMILSILSKVFDPLGLYIPSTIRFRWLFSKVVTAVPDWDSPLLNDHQEEVRNLLKEHEEISNHCIKRCLCPKNLTRYRLHIFSDASGIAYGACAYIEYERMDETKPPQLRLLRARAKIVKKGENTIPRLELAATIIGIRLFQDISSCDPFFENIEPVFWTDSMASLKWIQGTKQWPTFVENRVMIIRKLNLTRNFHYICSEANPADLLTRGLSFKKLRESELWWNGPGYNFIDLTDFLESPKMFKLTCEEDIFIDFSRFSSLRKLVNTMHYIVRFVNHTRGIMQTFDFDKCLTNIIKIDQEHYFS